MNDLGSLHLAWDDHLPLDLSFVYADEKPAGKLASSR
jgi:hypothetical protein